MVQVTSLAFFLGAALWATGVARAAEIQSFDGPEAGQKWIVIQGQIVAGDEDTFYDLTQGAERVSVLLESPGGEVEAGLAIGATIAANQFNTLVLDGDGCHSICAVVWVSGGRRYMSPEASISVHAAYRLGDGSGGPSESGVANASIGAYLNEIGLTRNAIEYFTVARPEEPLLPITPSIAQSLDIDVYVQDGDRIISPAERNTPRRIASQVVAISGLATTCSELLGVSSEFWSTEAQALLIRGHGQFGGEVFGRLLPELIEVVSADRDRDGPVRWCLRAESELRAAGVDTGITGPSFNCSRAATPTETAICGSQELWTLDRAVANLYFLFREAADSTKGQAFLKDQRAWLQRRDACGADTSCLMERYSSRLFDLGF